MAASGATRSGDFGDGTRGNSPSPDRNDPGASDARDGGSFGRKRSGGGKFRLPSEYADFILADGRRLEDVLGKSFFDGFDGRGPRGRGRRRGNKSELTARERMLAERRAQAKRLNQTRSILTGAQGVAGAANIDKSELSGG